MLQYNYTLTPHNSFGIKAIADTYFSYKNTNELVAFLKSTHVETSKLLILGGGTNVLFTQNFSGLVIHPENKGIHLISEDEKYIELEVQAGEDWDGLVEYCVNKAWYGLENLSLIPGSVGATPVQNIGAYGVEVKDSIARVNCIDCVSAKRFTLKASECRFDYRNSIFKQELKNTCVVVSVVYKLKKQSLLNTDYGDVHNRLLKYSSVGLKEVRKVICDIRNEKLPDYKVIGNAGSFFKNPVIEAKQAIALKERFPDIKTYDMRDGNVKLAAGWLIEMCGLKGIIENGAGVHPKQALVLINKGVNSGVDIYNLAKKVQSSVYNKFEVLLDFEVNIL
jgi:UDP-N-acetylmuramate dehydrogenase